MVKIIANIGVSGELNFRERRILQIMNVASTLLALVLLIPISYNLIIGEIQNGIILIFVSALYWLNLVWNSMRIQLIPKIVLGFGTSMVPVANLLISGSIPEGQFLSLLPVTVVSIFAALLVFDRYQEPFYYYFSIVYYTLYAAFFDRLCILFMTSRPQIDYLQEHYLFYKIPFVLSVIVIAAVFTFFKRIIYEYEESVEKARKMLELKNEELYNLNQGLEEKINKRTHELLASRSKIVDLAFIAAHEIRGPLTTILSYTSYLRKHMDDKELNKIIPQLHDRSSAMDDVVKKMVKSLEGEVDQETGKKTEPITSSNAHKYRPAAGV